MKKPKSVILRPAADRDLDDIVEFLRRESRQAATRFADAVMATSRLIAEHPGIGSTRHATLFSELPGLLRFHPVADFPRILVYYLERPDAVEVIRVWDASRGLEALAEAIERPPAQEAPATYRVRRRTTVAVPFPA